MAFSGRFPNNLTVGFVEYRSVIGHFNRHYLQVTFVIGRADRDARILSVLGNTQ